MVRASAIAVILLLPAAAAAQQQPEFPLILGKTFNSGGTIAVGGTAQNVSWNLATPLYRCVSNDPFATENLWVSFNSSTQNKAALGVGTPLGPGQQVCLAWTQGVSVWAATTGHSFGAFEGGQ